MNMLIQLMFSIIEANILALPMGLQNGAIRPLPQHLCNGPSERGYLTAATASRSCQELPVMNTLKSP